VDGEPLKQPLRERFTPETHFVNSPCKPFFFSTS
jgi:hypothetical protein